MGEQIKSDIEGDSGGPQASPISPEEIGRQCEGTAAQLSTLADRLRSLPDRFAGRDQGEAKLVRAAILARRVRDNSFPSGLFGEPAWDILLDLFLACLEGRRLTAAEVCIAAFVPRTTALRWVDHLCKEGLARRVCADDDVRFHLELTQTGHSAMQSYFGRAPGLWNGC